MAIKKMSGLTRKWLNALRSGEYKQTSSCLRNSNNEFCCLGVAVDVMAPSTWLKTIDDYGEYSYRMLGETSTITDDEFNRFVPYYIQNRLPFGVSAETLIVLNDGGYTFAQIADIIESWWGDNPRKK